MRTPLITAPPRRDVAPTPPRATTRYRETPPPSRTRSGTLAAARAHRVELTSLALAGGGAGISLGLVLAWNLPLSLTLSSVLTLVESVAAVSGTYLALVLLALAARIPALETALGQDRLIAVHRGLGPWAVYLVSAHVVLSVLARSLDLSRNPLAQLWVMIRTQPWILAATVACLLFVLVGITSWRRVRGRLARDMWWTIHLYAYLAVALGFAHQVVSGGPFLQGWARVWWTGLYVALAWAILWYRVGVPLRRTLSAGLRVARVVPEAPGVSSVWISGRGLSRWNALPGQFVTLRFGWRGLLWEGHSYSLSAPVRPDMMRVTIKDLGDASGLTPRITRGTRVLVEGPYGVMTSEHCLSTHAVLVGAGIGLAPMRSVAEGLARRGIRVDLVVRAHSERELLFPGELRALDNLPGVTVHRAIGPRRLHPLDAPHLRRLVPDVATADLYACGPEPLLVSLEAEARRLGIDGDHTHIERFTL